jgi:chromosome segregation ATPase
MTEFLETRSMNLNVRVSPQTKRQLTDKAQQLGLNMTDYIYVVIAKSEAIATDLETLNAEKSELEQQVRLLQANLANAKKEAESNVAMLTTGKSKLEQQVLQLQTNLAHAKKEAESEVATLNTGKSKLEQQVRLLQANLANLKKEAENDVETLHEEKTKLQQQVRQLQANLARYENLVAPIAKEFIGLEVTNQHKQRVVMKDNFQVAELVFSNFKYKKS